MDSKETKEKELHDMWVQKWMDKDPLPWKAWGSWFSWGSPVGLSIFFISIVIVIFILRFAFVAIH